MEGVRRGEKVQPEDRRQALAAGFDHPLAKPVNADDLAVLLRDCASACR